VEIVSDKILVLGLGQIGRAIVYYLDRLNLTKEMGRDDYDRYEIHGADLSPMAMLETKTLLGEKESPMHGVYTDGDGIEDTVSYTIDTIEHIEPSIVISALPYHINPAIARACIDRSIPYIDLGGSNSGAEAINDMAREAGQLVMTDLGLAPGLVNIMAEGLYEKWREHDLHGIEMFVGGLPINSNINPLKYTLNWSIDGLVNEYIEDCNILSCGEIKTKPGMSGLEAVNTKNLGYLEAFNTSGGAASTLSLMKERGVRNCSYKTLRYVGHHTMASFLMRDSGLNKEELSKVFTATEPVKDLAIIALKLTAMDSSEDYVERVYFPQNGMSAMQAATAAPVAIVATLILDEYIPRETDRPLTYSDIPLDRFTYLLDNILL